MIGLACALAFLPLPLVAAGIVGLAAVVYPILALYAAILSVPLQELINLPLGLSATQAAVVLLTGGLLLRFLAHPERPLRLPTTIWPWLSLLAALLLATSLTPYDSAAGMRETARWGVALLIWFAATQLVERPWHVVGLIICLLAAPLANGMYGLFQFFTGDGPPSFRIAVDSPFVRAYGTMGQPNSFAGYVNMGWPLALALALGLTIWRWQTPASNPLRQHITWPLIAVCWLVAGGLLAALGASFSRGAWLGAVGGLLAMALVAGTWARRGALLLIVLGVLVLTLGGFQLLPDALERRLASITASFVPVDPATVTVTPENFAVIERAAHLQAGLVMAQTHPLTGVGPGNFNNAFIDVTVSPWYVSRGHAHNYYLHMAAEAGVFGLIAYLTLIGTMALRAFRLANTTTQPLLRILSIGCCGIIAAVATHNLFENLHVLNMGIQLAATWALISVVTSLQLANKDVRNANQRSPITLSPNI